MRWPRDVSNDKWPYDAEFDAMFRARFPNARWTPAASDPNKRGFWRYGEPSSAFETWHRAVCDQHVAHYGDVKELLKARQNEWPLPMEIQDRKRDITREYDAWISIKLPSNPVIEERLRTKFLNGWTFTSQWLTHRLPSPEFLAEVRPGQLHVRFADARRLDDFLMAIQELADIDRLVASENTVPETHGRAKAVLRDLELLRDRRQAPDGKLWMTWHEGDAWCHYGTFDSFRVCLTREDYIRVREIIAAMPDSELDKIQGNRCDILYEVAEAAGIDFCAGTVFELTTVYDADFIAWHQRRRTLRQQEERDKARERERERLREEQNARVQEMVRKLRQERAGKPK